MICCQWEKIEACILEGWPLGGDQGHITSKNQLTNSIGKLNPKEVIWASQVLDGEMLMQEWFDAIDFGEIATYNHHIVNTVRRLKNCGVHFACREPLLVNKCNELREPCM